MENVKKEQLSLGFDGKKDEFTAGELEEIERLAEGYKLAMKDDPTLSEATARELAEIDFRDRKRHAKDMRKPFRSETIERDHPELR